MHEHLLSPSKITAWLDCAHYLTLREQVDAGLLKVAAPTFGSFAQLLVDKGRQHELDCLKEYRRLGRSVFDVTARVPRKPDERFDDWVARVGAPWEAGFDVIYQMPFLHDGIRGIADFLIRVEAPKPGSCAYEPVDAKLARAEAKPGHVLQLCFYAEALRAATGSPPEHLHLWLGSGRMESWDTREFRPYWSRLRGQLRTLLDDDAPLRDTRPQPCSHCEFCEFAAECEGQWLEEDSLVFVAGIRASDRTALEESSIATLAELAGCASVVQSIRPERLERLVTQAELQVEARDNPNNRLPLRLIPPGEDRTWGRGLEWLPKPDAGDVFLDFEGDPFWRADYGLFFLFGLVVQDPRGEWIYQSTWAHDRAEEQRITVELIEFLESRRLEHPDLHVYHYNHTERSALERLAAEYGIGESTLSEMVEAGVFVDLYPVVRNSVQVGTESYGLKAIERLASYERSHDIDTGSGAVVEYERYMRSPDQSTLDKIAAYNEDDVRATLALRDWLVGLRPEDMPWRAPRLDPEDTLPEVDQQIEKLHQYGPDSSEHLLGDLLGYWRRKRRANQTPKAIQTLSDTATLLDDPEVLAGLDFLGVEPRYGKNGKAITPGARFRWPEQMLSSEYGPGGSRSLLYGTPEGPIGYASAIDLDETQRELLVTWNDRAAELDFIPTALTIDDWVSPKPKPAALSTLAAGVLKTAGLPAPNPASLALLRRDLPLFGTGEGPSGGLFTDDLDRMKEWARHLDGSYVTVQGPPGTGKTFWGAHIAHSLISAGRRVGICAMSHHAIDNMLEEVVSVFSDEGDSSALRAVRRVPRAPAAGPAGITYVTSNAPCAKSEFNLVAGTTWLFSGNDLSRTPVDVLIIDEAGQLALADALAASTSARNLILLGDPLQLPQVSQALHPGGGGLSVLEHVLGDHVTLPTNRGVFLTHTRRMHPDVCRFISEEIYEGRLASHPSCDGQSTQFGTGLRWLRAEHADRSTESAEEAQIVARAIEGMLGTTWVNEKGETRLLSPDDFMVVAPYNDQVDLLRDTLDGDDRTHGVPVGTVDKFQGREAAVVFFSMTTSSSDHMPRSSEFLFSRNRLNVAISRARCLAYLVCTEALLNSRAKTVEEMRLISTLCSFVEYCGDDVSHEQTLPQ